MKSKVWLSKVLMASLMMAVAAVGASAQDWRRYSERDIYQLAQRNGYRMGVREGRIDRRNNERFDYKRHRAYKDGKYGYRDEYRHDGNYKDGFRNGFAAGYRDGYNGYNTNDRWDNNGRYDDRYGDRNNRRNGSWGNDDWDDDDYNRRNRNSRNNRNNNRQWPWNW
jgi:hypothetical protein